VLHSVLLFGKPRRTSKYAGWCGFLEEGRGSGGCIVNIKLETLGDAGSTIEHSDDERSLFIMIVLCDKPLLASSQSCTV
jgi:hypothetical protein